MVDTDINVDVASVQQGQNHKAALGIPMTTGQDLLYPYR